MDNKKRTRSKKTKNLPSAIAKMKCIEEVYNYYLKIISCMPNNVYWLDRNCITQGCNENVLKFIGLNNLDEFIGISYEQMGKIAGWKEGHAQLYKQDDMEVMASGKPKLNIEDPPIHDENGNASYYLSSRVPICDDKKNVIGIVGISVDITELKKTENELKKAKEQAEVANHAKTEFIANMSHDIRTPLTGIIGITDILEKLEANPELKQYAHDIHDCGQQLLTMLNSILDVVSADHVSERDKIIEHFDLCQCIQDIVNLEKPTIVLKKLDLDVRIDPAIPACLVNDKTKIHRILLNLFGNAVKFTEQGSITLSAELLHASDNQATVRFAVADTGIGIAQDQQDKVFDRFFRGSPSCKGRYAGHGVGLHIAQSYAKLLGGEIKFHSQEGKGSTFFVDLTSPVGHKGDQLNAQKSTATMSTENHIDDKAGENTSDLTFLLVEDSPIALKVLEAIVTNAGFHFISKIDGESALELAKTQTVDLIITDIGLPGMSGTAFVSAFRQWEQSQGKKPTPIIALTAHAQNDVKEACLKAGINEVFSKPFSSEILSTVVEKIVPVDTATAGSSSGLEDEEINKLGVDLPDEEEDLFLLDTYPFLDIEKALSFVGNNKILLKNILITMLTQEIPAEKIAFKAAYDCNNWDNIAKLAHKMKGGAAYIGTEKLKIACQYLERYHKAGHIQCLEKLYQQMMFVINKTENEIKSWCANQV